MQLTNLCLHELFEEQARRSPRAPAVVDERGELTCEELDRQADLLASHLRGVGIGPDEVVGVYMGRCAEYVVACLAALKVGVPTSLWNLPTRPRCWKRSSPTPHPGSS
jgi:non-ribosomal peptide synthetase component F